MPVYSMTGYAYAHENEAVNTLPNSAELPQLGVEIRSVNSRFLDIAIRLPEDLRSSEPALRELLQSQLKRGKIELRLAIHGSGSDGLQAPSCALLQKLNTLQDNIKIWLPDAQALSVADVLKMASSQEPAAKLPVDAAAQALNMAKKALGMLLVARQSEGSKLVAALLERVTQLRCLAVQAEPLVPQLMALQKARFMERFKQAIAMDASIELSEPVQERAMVEAATYAIRIDIAEEITRLQAHLNEIEKLLTKGGEIGKRLDFLTQELHREANTLGAKSASLEMTHISIDMKVLIEQIREQVQNLE